MHETTSPSSFFRSPKDSAAKRMTVSNSSVDEDEHPAFISTRLSGPIYATGRRDVPCPSAAFARFSRTSPVAPGYSSIRHYGEQVVCQILRPSNASDERTL